MKDLVAYWADHYDWRKHEAVINAFPQFTADINGTHIHFWHVPSTKPNAPALLLTHGWPDSFYRFHKVVPLLTHHFNLVIPSIPGFGFSEPKAMNSKKVAHIWAKLMTKVLGYESFLAAGGDLVAQ